MSQFLSRDASSDSISGWEPVGSLPGREGNVTCLCHHCQMAFILLKYQMEGGFLKQAENVFSSAPHLSLFRRAVAGNIGNGLGELLCPGMLSLHVCREVTPYLVSLVVLLVTIVNCHLKILNGIPKHTVHK